MSTSRSFRRIATVAMVLGVIALAMWSAASTALAQQGEGHVGVVFQFAEGQVVTRYLELPTPVDRLSALEATGFAFESAFGGDAVCKIEGTGCPGNDTDCWCQCPFTPEESCTFWIYFPMNETGDGWGDMNTWPLPELEDGHVGAWVWGEVDVVAAPWQPLVEVPFLAVDEIRQRALTPGTISAVGGERQLAISATFGGDSDGSGSATVRYRRDAGPWSDPQPMVRGDTSMDFAITGVDPGTYEVEVTYSDTDSGVIDSNGATNFTAAVVAAQVSAAEVNEPQRTAEVPPEAAAPSLADYASTLGFGAVAFVAILAALIAIYLRRRAS